MMMVNSHRFGSSGGASTPGWVQTQAVQGTLTAVMGSTPVVGNWLVAVALTYAVAPTLQAGWAAESSLTHDAGTFDPCLRVAYRQVQVGDTSTVTPWTTFASRFGMVVFEVAGMTSGWAASFKGGAVNFNNFSTALAVSGVTPVGGVLALAAGLGQDNATGMTGAATLDGAWGHQAEAHGIGAAAVGGTQSGVAAATTLTATFASPTGTDGMTGVIIELIPGLGVAYAPSLYTVGVSYSVTPVTANATGSVTYALTAGTLPTGLSLNTSTGEISGPPSVSGNTTGLAVTGTDSLGSATSAAFALADAEYHAYWRIYVSANQGATSNVGIGELEFRASSGGADQCSGGTPSASSELSGTYSAAKAFANDGGTTFWVSNGGVPQWIRYQFASAVTVQEVFMQSRNDAFQTECPAAFDVQYSDDGTTWTTYWSKSGIAAWTANLSRVFTK